MAGVDQLGAHLDPGLEDPQQEQQLQVQIAEGPNPAKRLCLENFSSFSFGEDTDNTISMDNSSEVVTKIAGLYAERLMSDVLLVVGKFDIKMW